MTNESNEVLIGILRRAVETCGHYAFVQGQQAETELRRRGVKVWNINWNQSNKNILSDARLSFPPEHEIEKVDK